MGEQNAESGFDTNAYVRRSTIMTGLVDYTLLITTSKLIKTFLDAGSKIDHYYLLVSITSLLLIVLVVMLVLAFIVFGPKITIPVEIAQFEKIMHLRVKMDEFRGRYKIAKPTHKTRLPDNEVLAMFKLDTKTTVNENAPTYKEEYYDKVIAEYKRNFTTNDTTTPDEDIWLDLTDTLKQYKNVKATVQMISKTRKRTEIMNDAISGLSGIVLLLMILIEVFSGKSSFKTFTN